MASILSDDEIRSRCMGGELECMIWPFQSHLARNVEGHPIISKGLSSFGYDISLSTEFKLFTNVLGSTIDPKRFDPRALVDIEPIETPQGEAYVLLPPNSYLLGRTQEYFRLPKDVTGLVIGKSTYARAGITINCTPAEAGWEGYLVVEIGNLTNLPARVYAREGIAQMLFFQGSQPCSTSYADRNGKYQKQLTLQLPLV